jgi:hypothetical protein
MSARIRWRVGREGPTDADHRAVLDYIAGRGLKSVVVTYVHYVMP